MKSRLINTTAAEVKAEMPGMKEEVLKLREANGRLIAAHEGGLEALNAKHERKRARTSQANTLDLSRLRETSETALRLQKKRCRS